MSNKVKAKLDLNRDRNAFKRKLAKIDDGLVDEAMTRMSCEEIECLRKERDLIRRTIGRLERQIHFTEDLK